MKAQLLSYQIHTAVVHPGILCPARPFGKNRNDKQPILGTGLNCNEFCIRLVHLRLMEVFFYWKGAFPDDSMPKNLCRLL